MRFFRLPISEVLPGYFKISVSFLQLRIPLVSFSSENLARTFFPVALFPCTLQRTSDLRLRAVIFRRYLATCL